MGITSENQELIAKAKELTPEFSEEFVDELSNFLNSDSNLTEVSVRSLKELSQILLKKIDSKKS